MADLQFSPQNPSQRKVNAARKDIDAFVWSLKGTTSTMITACETKTGVPFYNMTVDEQAKSLFENCIVIGFETEVGGTVSSMI